MFLEDEDWNDDRGAEVLSTTKPKDNCSPVKTKVVGKKSLLRTLQTLGSVPDWKSEQPQRDSDSETETPSAEHAHKKKKRRRKRRHSETQQTENGDLSQKDTEDTAVVKKKKDQLGQKRKATTTNETNDRESSKPPKVEADSSEKKISRQQWKNKMKNKRKSKNKFKSNTAAQDVRNEDTDSNCNIANEIVSKNVVQKKVKKQQIDKKWTEIEQEERPDEVNKKQSDENVVVIEDAHKELAKHQKFELSKKHNLKKEKLRKLLQSQASEQKRVEEVVPDEGVNSEPPDASASLRTRMEQRLESARFRYINEVLYSSTSGEAKRMFIQDPHAFWVYHRGYSAQVKRWPTNPVDNIIQFIQKRPPSQVVADFGCGDCKIAQSVKNKVHNFDLVATCNLVTACDMANVPLKDRSVDIAVFCLSLMGTNLVDFLKEANRVLKMGGVLKIAEVSSRFDNVRSFITALAGLGFKLVSKDTENTHFYSFEFLKTGPAPDNVKKSGLQLKPCVYKKR